MPSTATSLVISTSLLKASKSLSRRSRGTIIDLLSINMAQPCHTKTKATGTFGFAVLLLNTNGSIDYLKRASRG